MAGVRSMNTAITMQSHTENYLEERRRLGYRLRSQGTALRSFTRFIDSLSLEGPLTVETMAAWARRAKTHGDNPATWARRLQLLCPFARYLQQFDPLTEVPDSTTFGYRTQRLAPHIYSEQEMVDLLAAACRLDPDLRGATYEGLFGLLASTGLRVSEAVHLMDADVELKSGLLTVRQTKFAKSRQVPLHPSTVEALRRYRGLRNRHVAVTDEMMFFVGSRGRRRGCALGLRQVNRVFQRLRDQMGWVNRGAHTAPRIHDLRHTFVVRRVLLWHAQGVDVDQAMLALSTYIGHAKVTDTYWYLTGVPELMALVAGQFESLMPASEVHHA
jgi:integrase